MGGGYWGLILMCREGGYAQEGYERCRWSVVDGALEGMIPMHWLRFPSFWSSSLTSTIKHIR